MTKNETLPNALASESDDDSFVEVMEIDGVAPPVSEKPALKLSATPRHDVVGRDAKMSTTQICATIMASALPEDESNRAPVDIEVALDVSGSMHGEKLELCKTTLELLLRQLLPHDRFGLVTFADEAVIEIPTMKLTESNKAFALSKIKALRTRGCTNISAAIGMAAQELGAIEGSANEVRSIFLLTDGHANCGISHASGIVDVTKGCLINTKDDGSPPITIHCFGYGSDHDDKLLKDVSETTTGGTYYFVENDSNVATAFGDALGGILSVVAQNAVLNIQVAPEAASLGASIAKVHHENVIQREDGSYTVTIGDFYAEESRDVLLDITLARPSDEMGATPIPHVSMRLSFTDTLKKGLVVTPPVTCAIARPPGMEVSLPNPRVLVQWLRIHTANEIEAADKLSSRGDLDGARNALKRCKDVVKAEESIQSDPLVGQLAADLDTVLGGLTSYSFYQTHGTKICNQTMQTHRRQRCSEATYSAANVYRGTHKMKMAKKFDSNK